ncbi:hypothetical protein DFS34DRAFT_639085 [Phlyctochytrium arcticum]|nr:hypothetical protein DFS34DRAFT_639085 [Phlyctochytrium arcticum]
MTAHPLPAVMSVLHPGTLSGLPKQVSKPSSPKSQHPRQQQQSPASQEPVTPQLTPPLPLQISKEDDVKDSPYTSPSPTTSSTSSISPNIALCILPVVSSTSLADLPRELQSILRNLPFFPLANNNTELAGIDDFLIEISQVMHLRHFSPGDVIVHQGEKARALFFVIRGIVKVMSDDGEINFAEIRTGSYFGEIGVLFNIHRTATVVAKTKCTLAILTSEELERKLCRYPEVNSVLRDEANARYADMKREMEKAGRRVPSERDHLEKAAERRDSSHGSLKELSASRIASRRPSTEDKMSSPSSPNMRDGRRSPVEEFSSSTLAMSVAIVSPPPSSGAVITSTTTEAPVGGSPSPISHLASRYNGRRRASVAVWSDDRLMQFAQATTDKHEGSGKEKLPAAPPKSRRLSASSPTTSTIKKEHTLPTSAEVRAFGVLGRENMAHVFRFLDFRQRMRVRILSMDILRLLLDPQAMLTTSVDLSPWHKRIDNQVITNVICFCGKTVRELSLRNCWGVTDKGLAAIAHYASNCLENLCLASVWDITDSGIASMARMCSQLKELDLSNCRKLSDAGVCSVLDACRGIETLTLSYCKSLTDNLMSHPRWATVKRIILQRCTGIFDAGFERWVEQLKNLAVKKELEASQSAGDASTPGSTSQHPVVGEDGGPLSELKEEDEEQLEPSHSLTMSDQTMPASSDDGGEDRMDTDTSDDDLDHDLTYDDSMSPCSSTSSSLRPAPLSPSLSFALQELILSDCSFLTTATVSAVAASCHHLEILSLSFCCALTEEFADHLTKGCPRLRALDMSFCGMAITDASLETLARGLRWLERLSIRGCIQVTERGILILARYARHLRMLNVSQCKNVDAPLLERVGRGWRLLTCQNLVEVDEVNFRKNGHKLSGRGFGRRDRARASTA